MVELMRKKTNFNSSIVLDACTVRVSKNWFVIVGVLEK